MARMIDADKLIENFKNTEDAEGSMWTLSGILSEIEDTVLDEEENEKDTLLYKLLKEHAGHTVEIAEYGDGDNFALEDMDTEEIIFDTDLYDLIGIV